MEQPPRASTRLATAFALTHDEWWCNRVLSGVFVVLLHSLACVYYTGSAMLHVYIPREPRAASMINLVGRDILDYFDVVVAASVALVVVHGLANCAIICTAMSRCVSRRVRAKSDIDDAHNVLHPAQSVSSRRALWHRLLDTLERWDCAFERYCGMDSYELLVVVEIGLQMFQAYKLSHLIATLWINRLVVCVIAVNCWFMPAMRVAFRKKTPTFVKVVQLALDALLEVVYGMAVPFAIYHPYSRDAHRIFYDLPWIGYYDDTWSINAVAENRQIFVTSWLDFCSKMAPGVGLFVRLSALETQRNEYEQCARTTSQAKVLPFDDDTRDDSTHSAPQLTAPPPTQWVKRIVNGAMIACGLVVLALHLAAGIVSTSGSDRSCLLEIRPMGSTQYTCTVLEVSCTQRRIVGTKRELDEALQHVDPLRVQGLIFSHCEALSMPPRLKAFPRLVSIKIHNCTIAEWSDDAALTAWSHPAIQTLYITLTNMNAIPVGLLSSNFPPLLRNIGLCGTNLTSLPLDLFETWRAVNYFALELSPGITEFPPALLHASAAVPWLTLSSNAITALPDDLFALRTYRFFYVAGNPLTRLPAQVGSAASTPRMSIAHTNITEIPASWTTSATYAELKRTATKSRFVLTADHSPLCSRALADKADQSSQDAAMVPDTELKVSWLPLQCLRNSSRFYYPLEHELQWRRVNRE